MLAAQRLSCALLLLSSALVEVEVELWSAALWKHKELPTLLMK